MTTVIISHEVKDYADWKKVYDADDVNRSKSGIHITGLYHSVENSNMITLVGEAPSVEAVTQFMSNPLLKEAMERGGVLGVPEVKILSKI